MFERLFHVIKAGFDNLVGKVEDPATMLEQTYSQLCEDIVQARIEVLEAIETKERLQKTLLQSSSQQHAGIEMQLTKQEAKIKKLRERLKALEDELHNAQSKKYMLNARDKAARATMKANQILSKENSDGTVSNFDRLQALLEGRRSNAETLEKVPINLHKLFAKNIFALVWLVVNISFLYLLCRFAPLPTTVQIYVIPAMAFFLCWIWWRQNNWFFHNATILWSEISKDLRNIKSNRKD